jgi:dTDP-4-dehydrorhamnose 3,5-epimerase
LSSDFASPRLLDLAKHEDDRGWFMELHNRSSHPLAEADFPQDNVSLSHRWTLRGLHYQLPPDAQGKLIWIARGSVFDAVVDVRKSSEAFGHWWGYTLDDSTPSQLWIPPGFAHGFLALDEPTVVVYKVTAPHAPSSERSIRWDDPAIGIEWPLDGREPIVSDRDRSAPTLEQAEVFD